jgi:hypothetical protein
MLAIWSREGVFRAVNFCPLRFSLENISPMGCSERWSLAATFRCAIGE